MLCVCTVEVEVSIMDDGWEDQRIIELNLIYIIFLVLAFSLLSFQELGDRELPIECEM